MRSDCLRVTEKMFVYLVPCSNLVGFTMPWIINDELHTYMLACEASFVELSTLEERRFIASDLGNQCAFCLSLVKLWRVQSWGEAELCPLGSVLPLSSGKYMHRWKTEWVVMIHAVEKECSFLIWDRRDTLLAFVGKENNTPQIEDYSTEGFGVTVSDKIS